MKQESVDHLKNKLIESLKKYGDNKFLVTADPENLSHLRTWSGNQIAVEIEQETEFGLKQIDMMIQLTLDLLSRDKIKPLEENKCYRNHEWQYMGEGDYRCQYCGIIK